MKSSELRIGNYVDYYHESADRWYHNNKVSANDIVCIDLGASDHAKGIPLTEEWLLKFGFEDNSYAVFYKKFNGSEFISISFKDYAHTKLAEQPVSVSDYDLPIECKYVHQLQNLYFALTGKELEIK